MDKLSILIGGDLVPTESNYVLFSSANTTELIGDDLLNVLRQVDFRVFNLEVPLANKEAPIMKCGPNLIAPISTIKGIKQLQADLLTLSNNHILDQGVQGFYSTIKVLEENDIDYVGAGSNLKEATKPYIWEKNGIRVGFYTCAEHEFSVATPNSPGANPFDPLESLDHIQSLKDMCDYVIVLYHGGKEHYRYPSPYLQKVCRKIVQKGADLIVCQHSHCIGSYEEYEGSTIIYGQGNFIFDESDNEFWNSSLLVKVNILDSLKIDYIPIVKEGNSIRIGTGTIAEDILTGFYSRSKEILDEGFIENNFNKFAAENIKSYLTRFSGFGKFIYKIDRRILKNMLLKRQYNLDKLLAIQNYIECEAHRELVIAGLKGAKAIERK